MQFLRLCYKSSTLLIILLLLYVNNPLSATISSSTIPTYSCPSTPNESITLPSSNGLLGQGRPIQLKITEIGQLCTLVRHFSGDSKDSEQDYIQPVARSYNGHEWEAAPGDYSYLSFQCDHEEDRGDISSLSLKPTFCQVIIPGHLPLSTNDNDEEKHFTFQLTLFEYSLTPKEEIARFLEQATFGPTRKELNQLQQSLKNIHSEPFTTSKDPDALQPLFAQWVQSQMNTSITPMTSHREMWRKRTSPIRKRPDVEGAISHPCDYGSRYTSDALVYHLDLGKEIMLIRVPNLMESLEERTVKANSMVHDYEEEDNDNSIEELEEDSDDVKVNLRARYNSTIMMKGNKPFYGWYSLSIEGQFRSMVKGMNLNMEFDNGMERREFLLKKNDYADSSLIFTTHGRVFLDEGKYQICGNEYLGVRRMGVLVPTTSGDDSNETDERQCIFFPNGTPQLSLGYRPNTNLLINEWRSSPLLAPHIAPYVLVFPDESVTAMPSSVHWHTDQRDRNSRSGVVVTQPNELDVTKCKAIPHYNGLDIPPTVLIKLSNDRLMMHTPHLIWDKNTRSEPLRDGGGKTVLSTGGSAYCSNVPPTFLNEDACHISDEPTACSSDTSALGTLRLNTATLQKLYEATGQVIYAISNLRVEDGDETIQTPCTYGQASRWKRVWNAVAGSKCPINVHHTTQQLFSNLIQESEDDNLLVRDVASIPYEVSCHPSDASKKRLVVQVDDDELSCWKSIHPEELNVYGFTSWGQRSVGGHPGNSNSYNPILDFAKRGEFKLKYPMSHKMSRWNSEKNHFHYIGRLGDEVEFINLPDIFKIKFVAETFGIFSPQMEEGKGIVTCGSPGEVANTLWTVDGTTTINDDNDLDDNDLRVFDGRTFDITQSVAMDKTSFLQFKHQKKTVWTTIALMASDQLRQRVAWALSQLLVIDPSVAQPINTEIYLHYYDIFVRHAYGNYKDILKEVAYSPMMSETLSYYQSKSSEYVWKRKKQREFPDENFSRELCQLFSIGLVELNMNGTNHLDEKGMAVRTYSNTDIMEYARAWTGFDRQNPRGNVEERSDFANSIDPMTIQIEWRDHLPKMGLNRKYVGDGYFLCSDLPQRPFLLQGAKFRLISKKELFQLPFLDTENVADVKVLKLDASSELWKILCQSKNGSCSHPGTVELQRRLRCWGDECKVASAKVVQLSADIFYEYIQPPCVYFPFFNNGKLISKRGNLNGWKKESLCVDPESIVAAAACTGSFMDIDLAHHSTCEYTGELLSHNDARLRCDSQDETLSDHGNISPTTCGECCAYSGYFWTNSDCNVFIIVNKRGKVAIERKEIYKQYYSHTFFRVDWVDDFPSVKNECGYGTCEKMTGRYCRCSISIKNLKVFESLPSRQEILSKLHIGGIPPHIGLYLSKEKSEDVHAYFKRDAYTRRTVFEVQDNFGQKVFLKNMQSKVLVLHRNDTSVVSHYTFRNPPQFYSAIPEKRMAIDETEAVIDHVFYHSNTAPFIAKRFLQRFGISNPTPGYIQSVAEAFHSGVFRLHHTYSDNNYSFEYGDGNYGNMAATVASILLHRESRHVILDTDPSHGSLREPLIKVISAMKSLEYTQTANEYPSLFGMDASIGQEQHEIPSVFSFFLPEYSPPGRVSSSSLVSPEAMLLHNSINLLNGIFSLVKFGLTPCHEGFGHRINCYWESSLKEGSYENSAGHLSLAINNNLNDPSAVVDELATLLTSGRLSKENRQIIKDTYIAEKDKSKALRMAQQLVFASSEFHATGLSRRNEEVKREQTSKATKSCKRYKAVIHILLAGGCDSFNMLVPHSRCEDKCGKDLFQEYKNERGSVALKKEELLKINAESSNQPCSMFGLHPSLKRLQSMYNEKDALFLANIGVMNQPVSSSNYAKLTNVQLFAHNAMQAEIGKLGTFRKTRMLGRLADILTKKGLKVDSFAMDTSLVALEGLLQNTTKVATSSKKGFKRFDPASSSEKMLSLMEKLNGETKLQSSIFSETWSSMLHKSLAVNNELFWAQHNTKISQVFPTGSNDIGRQLELVSKMIASSNCRGSDRDIFYLEVPQYDHHSKMITSLKNKFNEMNNAFQSFVNEMKNQDKWNDITVVVSSDFGRTLSPNSGGGTDHAWSGHAFILGGEVDGGKILGDYPNDLTANGPLNIGRGRLLPTMSWDALWNGVVEWTGVHDDNDLDYILPNRRLFPSNQILSKSDLFQDVNPHENVGCEGEGSFISCIPDQLHMNENSTNIHTGNDTSRPQNSDSSQRRTKRIGTGAIVGIVLSCSILIVCVGLSVLYRNQIRYLWFQYNLTKYEKNHRRDRSDDLSTSDMTLTPPSSPYSSPTKNTFVNRLEEIGYEVKSFRLFHIEGREVEVIAPCESYDSAEDANEQTTSKTTHQKEDKPQ